MVDTVVGCAGKEELQGTGHFLSQALHKGLKYSTGIVVGQFATALFCLGFFGRKTILPCNQLRQLCATKGLVALIEHFIIAQHLHAGCHRTHFKECNNGILSGVRQA